MRALLINTFLLLCLAVSAQDGSLNVSLSRNEILIGEQTELLVEYRSATSDTVVFPDIKSQLIEALEIVEAHKIDTQFIGDQLETRLLSQHLILTSFDSGYFAQPPIQVAYSGDSISSDPLLLVVQTIPIDTAKGIADIKEIRQVPFAWKEWIKETWHWFAIGLMAIILITWLVFYLSKEKQAPEAPAKPQEPEIPPHIIALEALANLRDAKLWQQGNVKGFYTELSTIFRSYLEGQFRISALEQTTEEIMTALQHQAAIDKEELRDISQLLFLSDLVKFAKEKPIGSENEQNIERVERFIRAKIQQEDTPPLKNEDHG